MRVVVVGATGNVGTSLLQALAAEPRVNSIVGIARRPPAAAAPKTEWVEADIASTDLVPHFRGADAVVHLAWLIQPSHDVNALWLTNVAGSGRVFRAIADAGVQTLVYASSVGAYSEGPKDRLVDESWPTGGIASSFYSRHKSEVELRLDRFERESPQVRVVRFRPALIFKREAGSHVRRIFAGRLFPSLLARPSLVPLVPDIPGLRFQALHTDDAAAAYRLAITSEAKGAFNLAGEPVLDPTELARLLGARPVPLPARAARGATALSWWLHLQPTPPGWLDLALRSPLLDWSRARRELGWMPTRSAGEAFLELLDGIRDGAGEQTPALAPEGHGFRRLTERLRGTSR